MAKRKPLRQRLDELETLGAEADPQTLARALESVLEKGESPLVARAARIAADADCSQLVGAIAASFARFMIDPVDTDKSCRAKAACADALRRLWYDDPACFLAGARHRQMEPVWGGREDTACGLRVGCIAALAEMGYHDTHIVAADLLADPEEPVRRAAAQALGDGGIEQGEALLRLKALLGDDEVSVTQTCLEALLKVATSTGPAFVAGFLEAEDEATAEAAALALGATRTVESFERLRGWYEREVLWTRRRAALIGIALCRHEAAIDFVLEVLRDGADAQARDAVRALAVHSPDVAIRRQALEAAAGRGDPALAALIEDSL